MLNLEIENKKEVIKKLEDICFGNSAYSIEQIEDMIMNEKYKIYSLEKAEKKIAYIILYDNTQSLEIIKIGIALEERGKNLGEILLNKAKEKGKEIFLEVRESNIKAMRFYEKNCFSKIGKRKNYYTNPNENAIVMMWKK